MSISVMITAFKAGFEIGKRGLHIMFPIDHFDGVAVYHDDLLVAATCGSHSPMAVTTMMSTGFPGIIVNQGFIDASFTKEQRESIYAHEVGHSKLGHLEEIGAMSFACKLLGRKRMIEIELEADQYARDTGHDVDDALLVMSTLGGDIKKALVSQGRI